MELMVKVIILAGGWGTRLGHYTENTPKPMLEIGNKPIIWHIMKIYATYGYNEFIICIGANGHVIKDYFYHYAEKNNDFTIDLATGTIDYFTAHAKEDWKVTLVDTGLNTLKGARIKKVEKFLDPGYNMVTYGDGVADIDIGKLVAFHESHGKIVTITGVTPPSRFGELVEEDGQVTSFKEKPQTSIGLINGGFMVFNNEMLDHLTTDEKCDFEHGALEQLSELSQVMVYKHQGNWECMDTERDFNNLNSLWNSGNSFWKVWSD